MKADINLRLPTLVLNYLFLYSFAVLILSGCTTPMVLDANKQDLSKLTKPIGIFTLITENAFKPSYQPKPKFLLFRSSMSDSKALFEPGEPYRQAENKFFEYLISVDLPAGQNIFYQVQGVSGSFPIQGHFAFPINASFNLSNGITYLGNVTMINRERKEGETRSGLLVPLIDQAVTGFGNGTFDISITDRSETDIPDFIRAYPALKGVKITKFIMQK